VLAGTISSLVQWCTERLAWSFLIFEDDAFWHPHMEYIGFRRQLETNSGSVVYGHDWRRFPVGAWLDFMAGREHAGGTGPVPESMLRPPPPSRDAFGAAVRAALPQLNRPGQPAGPLVGTALGETPAQVRASIVEAIRRLAGEPKGEQPAAVLHRTYVRPAPTQEAAAEALGQPFSTYRRHLAKAVDELTEILWAAEIGRVSSD
jgi:hypothetical protein